MKITIIGLGIDKGDLSLKAVESLQNSKKIIVRTGLSASYASITDLKLEHVCLDDIYLSSRNYDTLNKKLAAYVLSAAKQGEVTYCVDGAVSEDKSAAIILSRVKDAQVIEGVSRASRAASLCSLSGKPFTACSAYDLDKIKGATLPVIVYDIDGRLAAGSVKLFLTNEYGDDVPAYFACNGKIRKIVLYELDRQPDYSTDCAVAVDEVELIKKERFNFTDLVGIVKKLHAPDGCPWDRAQTCESIRINTIEEAYELVDAVDLDDDDKICEEAGDVILQAVFYAVMREETGAFSADDVISGLCKKLVERHTHIFGTDKAASAAEALNYWEKNKQKEKRQKTFSDAVNDVPKNMPALLYAQKVQKRAAKSGFDFDGVTEASEKVVEELNELLSACASGDISEISAEAGDLIFSAVNVARLAGADGEICLKDVTRKFIKRFNALESAVLADGKSMTELTSRELDAYYVQVKANENK